MNFLNHTILLAQAEDEGGGAILTIVMLAFCIGIIAGVWKTFEKAGKPGWGAIIPIYNVILMLEIAGKPVWWILLFFIPLVNFVVHIVVHIVVSIDIAKNFGKGLGFGLGIAFLGFIFIPILGFGDAKYQPPATS